MSFCEADYHWSASRFRLINDHSVFSNRPRQQEDQHDVLRLKVLYLKHVQPVHNHHSLNQVSFQINVSV